MPQKVNGKPLDIFNSILWTTDDSAIGRINSGDPDSTNCKKKGSWAGKTHPAHALPPLLWLKLQWIVFSLQDLFAIGLFPLNLVLRLDS